MSTPAKDRFTGLDTIALARELGSLARARLDKVFDAPGPAFDLQFRVPSAGRRTLRVCPGRYGALIGAVEEREEGLSPFARELRRLLSGAVLQEVTDPGGERMLSLELRRGDVAEPLRVVFELFGAGNLLVVRGTELAAVLHPRAWAHRTLRVGAEYRAPPGRANPWQLDTALWAGALQGSRTDVVSSLAARLGLGGPVAEELLARTGVSGAAPAAEIAATEVESLVKAAGSLLTELGAAPSGYLYRDGEQLVDAEPFASRRWQADPAVREERTGAFSEASLAYFGSLVATSAPAPPGDERRDSLARQRARQESAVRELEAESERLRTQAETILSRYPEVVAGLARIASPGDGPVVELELDGIRLPLRLDRSPRQSAQLLFDERKRVELRLAGARAALESTHAMEGEAAPERGRERTAKASADRPRALWYERYRWFVSSEGVLVIAGRDAASNDRIVKRYLGSRDRYVHADLHGAASVVVKHPEVGAAEIGEATLREAGQWAVCLSKNWRAGRASADAFWVEAEQVSKSAESGEFVARGSWVVHGTRRLLRDLPLELGLGRVPVEGAHRWTVAPPEALRARGELLRLLYPGEERDRVPLERAVSRELGIDRDLLQSLLPAGGVRLETVSPGPSRSAAASS
ncbi:MAG TPA: ribosome rescue protein RqcH [Thermoplasmata archaeon]|nr:ribosome rescue protein RqcH [Thermoplasmata archaeon]